MYERNRRPLLIDGTHTTPTTTATVDRTFTSVKSEEIINQALTDEHFQHYGLSLQCVRTALLHGETGTDAHTSRQDDAPVTHHH